MLYRKPAESFEASMLCAPPIYLARQLVLLQVHITCLLVNAPFHPHIPTSRLTYTPIINLEPLTTNHQSLTINHQSTHPLPVQKALPLSRLSV